MKNIAILDDVNGDRYYRRGNDIVDKNGRLLTLAEEFNVRSHLRSLDEFERMSEKSNLTVGPSCRV